MSSIFASDFKKHCKSLSLFFFCSLIDFWERKNIESVCFANDNTPNEPPSLWFNTLGDYNRNSQESLNIKLFILATPESERAELQPGPIHICCDPQQHVVMLANQIWRQQVKGWPLWAVCFHKWICLIWEINRLLSNLASDWSYDLVTEKHDGCRGGATWWESR